MSHRYLTDLSVIPNLPMAESRYRYLQQSDDTHKYVMLLPTLDNYDNDKLSRSNNNRVPGGSKYEQD